MPLHPSIPLPERILAVGYEGSAKTTHWLNILRWAVRTKADTHFYVLDTDFAINRMMIGYPECIPYVTVFPCYDWMDYVNATKTIYNTARPSDWVVVDFIGSAWQAVQDYYVEQVFNQSIDAYFLKARKEISKDAKSFNALEGWVDYKVINPLYFKWVNPLLFKGQYHLYCTAQAEALSDSKKPTEDKQTRSLLSGFGIKPKGQKMLPFQFHTILLTGITPQSRARTISTIKDRERVEVVGKVVDKAGMGFTKDYLVDIAGWQLA